MTARPASHERGAAEGPSSRPHVKRGGVPSIGNALDNRRRHHQTEQHTVQNGYRGSEGHFRRQGRPCAGALTTSPVHPGTPRRVKGFTAVAGKMRAVDREKPVPRSTRGIAPPPPRRRPVVRSVGSFRVFTRWTYQRRSRDARSTARHVPRRRFRAAPVTSCRCRRPPERRPRRTQATFFNRG